MLMALDRRVQLLLDRERYERLEVEAARRGASVAAVIREAIDRTVGGDVGSRAEAAAGLLAAEPMPVGEWAQEKRHLADELSGGDDATGGDDGRVA